MEEVPYLTWESDCSSVVHDMTAEVEVILVDWILEIIGGVVSVDVPLNVVNDLTTERVDVLLASSVVLTAR